MSEISNVAEYVLDKDIGMYSSFGVASLDKTMSMEWGELAEEEWKITKKYLLWAVGMMDKMIVRAEELRKRAKEVRRECSKK